MDRFHLNGKTNKNKKTQEKFWQNVQKFGQLKYLGSLRKSIQLTREQLWKTITSFK